MGKRKLQWFAIALAILTIPAWWWTSRSVNLDSRDPIATYQELYRLSEQPWGSLIRKKLQWDLSHHADAYASFIFRACAAMERNPPKERVLPLSAAPAELEAALLRGFSQRPDKTRAFVANMLAFGMLDPDHDASYSALLTADRSRVVRGVGSMFLAIRSGRPEEAMALLGSRDPKVIHDAVGTIVTASMMNDGISPEQLTALRSSENPLVRAEMAKIDAARQR